MLTVDAVVFGVRDERLEVLTIQRKNPPFEGQWALPGGFVDEDEPLGQAVQRELQEETGIATVHLQQFHTFGDPGRDPRGWNVCCAYMTLIDPLRWQCRAGDDAADVAWLPAHTLPALAFDHNLIVETALSTLQGLTRSRGLGVQVLRPQFTLDDLRHLYEIILDAPLNAADFEETMVIHGVVEPVEDDAAAKPLFRFAKGHYELL